jgi:protease IV
MPDYLDETPPLDNPSRQPRASQGSSSRQTTLGPNLEATVTDMAAAWSQDRRSDRRWRLAFRVLWLLLAAAFLWALLSPAGKRSATGDTHTAVVQVRGEIAAGSEASAESIVQSLRDAFEAPQSRAVVLRINSPGGSPVQSGIINDEIKRLKAKHQKKIYAVVEEMCASGAYYIAVAADEIIVDKASLVGSIGVLMDGFGATGLMEKLGIERRLVTAGENKAMLDPFSPQNEKHNAHVKALLAQVHQQFITVVKEGRGARLKEHPDTFTGLIWNGEEAVRSGLADRVGNLDQVARDMVQAETLVDYTQQENVAERLARRFGASLGASVMQAVKSTGWGR